MQHPRSNVAAVIIRDHHLLLVEFDDASGLHYNLPGGGVDLNETMYDAVKREAWEETSAKVTADGCWLYGNRFRRTMTHTAMFTKSRTYSPVSFNRIANPDCRMSLINFRSGYAG